MLFAGVLVTAVALLAAVVRPMHPLESELTAHDLYCVVHRSTALDCHTTNRDEGRVDGGRSSDLLISTLGFVSVDWTFGRSSPVAAARASSVSV